MRAGRDDGYEDNILKFFLALKRCTAMVAIALKAWPVHVKFELRLVSGLPVASPPDEIFWHEKVLAGDGDPMRLRAGAMTNSGIERDASPCADGGEDPGEKYHEPEEPCLR